MVKFTMPCLLPWSLYTYIHMHVCIYVCICIYQEESKERFTLRPGHIFSAGKGKRRELFRRFARSHQCRENALNASESERGARREDALNHWFDFRGHALFNVAPRERSAGVYRHDRVYAGPPSIVGSCQLDVYTRIYPFGIARVW